MIEQVWGKLDSTGKGSVSKRELLSTLRSNPMVATFLNLPQHFHESTAKGSGNIAQALEAFRSMSGETGKITFAELQTFVTERGLDSSTDSSPGSGRPAPPPFAPPSPPTEEAAAPAASRASTLATLRALFAHQSSDALLQHMLASSGHGAISLREHDVQIGRADFLKGVTSLLDASMSVGEAAVVGVTLNVLFSAFDTDKSERISLSLVVLALRAVCVNDGADVAGVVAAVFRLYATCDQSSIPSTEIFSRDDFVLLVRVVDPFVLFSSLSFLFFLLSCIHTYILNGAHTHSAVEYRQWSATHGLVAHLRTSSYSPRASLPPSLSPSLYLAGLGRAVCRARSHHRCSHLRLPRRTHLRRQPRGARMVPRQCEPGATRNERCPHAMALREAFVWQQW